MLAALLALAAASASPATAPPPEPCLGEYAHCPATGECTLFECDGPGPHCGRGEYRCPISNHCVATAAAVVLCALATALTVGSLSTWPVPPMAQPPSGEYAEYVTPWASHAFRVSRAWRRA